jgi:hypothetical protein
MPGCKRMPGDDGSYDLRNVRDGVRVVASIAEFLDDELHLIRAELLLGV